MEYLRAGAPVLRPVALSSDVLASILYVYYEYRVGAESTLTNKADGIG